MAFTSLSGVAIRGIAGAVPATIRTNDQIGGVDDQDYVARLSAQVGVTERRVVTDGQYGSDLAAVAVESLLERLGWDPNSIDLLVVATQTPDRLFPGISFTLHRRFGLPQSTPVFDVNLGCSAFTHGLWTTASLLPGVGRRALLVNADTMSRTLGPTDWGNQVLFGDAGTATAFELDNDAAPIHVVLTSDGKGTEAACYPDSAMSASIGREPAFVINGPAVLGLALRSVPKLVTELLDRSGVTIDQVGLLVPHQANVFILDKLVDRLGLDPSRMAVSMGRYGNTSSASIPPRCACRELVDAADRHHTMMVGFGTGFSLSAVMADLTDTVFVGPTDVA